MSSLADSEKQALLRIARAAFVAGVERQLPPQGLPNESALRCPAGAFVTISTRGRLRGCIGQLPSGLALIEVVAHCARAVASEDPRFPPVRAEEIPGIEIELSVLSPLFDIQPAEIQAGVHGLLVSNGRKRGVLLPQVATQFRWNGMRLLEATCEKAGLAPDAWKSPDTQVQAFTAEVFSEAEFAAA